MLIALITDIHFGARNDSPLFLDNLTHFFDNTFFPALVDNGIKDLLILGDTWQNRRNINIHTMHVAKTRFFDVLEDMGVSVKIIYGNHDIFYKNTNDINSVDFLALQHKNVEVVETFKVFDFDNIRIGMMSWIPPENSEPFLEFLRTADCSVLCGHFEIMSFEMTAGHFCSGGLVKGQFQRYDKVLSGHFHIPSNDGRIFYLGNPLQTNWGDWNVEKGAWILDTSDVSLTRIHNPVSLFEKVHYSDDIDVIKFPYNEYANKNVRLFVRNLMVVEKNKFEVFVDRLADIAHDVEVHELEQITETVNEDVDITDCVSPSDIISLYVKSISLPESVDKDRFKDILLDVFKKTSERITV